MLTAARHSQNDEYSDEDDGYSDSTETVVGRAVDGQSIVTAPYSAVQLHSEQTTDRIVVQSHNEQTTEVPPTNNVPILDLSMEDFRPQPPTNPHIGRGGTYTTTLHADDGQRDVGNAVDDSEEDTETENLCLCYEPWTRTGSHRLVALRCGHLFGEKCVLDWIVKQKKKSCPICRMPSRREHIIHLYAKNLRAVDNTELVRVQAEAREQRDARLALENKHHKLQLAYKIQQNELARVADVITELKMENIR